jgi:hypothetical protein
MAVYARSAPSHHAAEEQDITLEEIMKFTPPKVVAMRRAGLGYHYDNSPRGSGAASATTPRRGGRPAARVRAVTPTTTLPESSEETAWHLPFVLHCFTGGDSPAAGLPRLVSFSGAW